MVKAKGLRMLLDCKVIFNQDVERIKKDLSKLVEKANTSLLIKGAPKDKIDEASEISTWDVTANELNLKIRSGTYVRAPVALLRFVKLLRSALGKYRVGVRSVVISRFRVFLPLTRKLKTRTVDQIKSIQKVSDARVEGDYLSVDVGPLTIGDLMEGVPDRLIKIIEEELERVTVRPTPVMVQVVRQGKRKRVKFYDDPADVALRLGWVHRFPGRGQWIYGPPYAALQEVIENLLVEEVAKKLDFQPCLLPKLIPFEVMKLMPGYFDGIPEGMYYVCPPPRDPERFKEFKEIFRMKRTVPRGLLKNVLKDPDYVLAPAQCEPFWYLFVGKSLEDLPIKLYDRSGWTYRWEGGGVEGLVRVQEFKRVELVYYGFPDDVVKIRDSVLNENIRVADKLLDLEWRVVPGIPFFSKEAQAVLDVHDSYKVGAYDLEVYMPYRGKREEAEWLEISACFVHKTKFIDAFKIREEKRREIWSGCTGMGVSRWVAAFLARHGFEIDGWPTVVKQRFLKYNVKTP